MDVLNVPRIKTDNINTRDLLIVGFNETSFKLLSKFKNGSNNYRLKRFDQPFNAYHWLKDKVENFLPKDYPKGILCDLTFLKEDKSFLNKILSDPILKTIPLIAISTDGTHINVKEALKMGIDDCYHLVELKWNNLKRRIEFLQRFKTEISNDSMLDMNESYEYKIPKGKRIFDICVASTVLLVLSPLLLLVALLIKVGSKGPIFYYSKRAGTGFQVFDFIKFRSMCQDADAKLVQLSHLNQYGTENSQGPAFVKLQNDPRVTSIGKIIRKTSIDELPQLINVLKGDMSIVGNRPLPLYEADQLTKDAWSGRFIAPAGLTGLWQISKRGKSDMSTEERIQLDIEYSKDYSIMMDLKILMKTLPAMIQDEQV